MVEVNSFKTRATGWKSSLAVLLALGISTGGVAPFLSAPPVSAQLLAQSRRGRVRAGTVIRATYEDARKIVLKPEETLSLDLVTTEHVRSSRGTILIPRGSTIEGQLEPRGNGTQFVADTLILRDGGQLNLNATSDVITRTETIKKGTNTDRIWQGALVGGAASAVISEIFSDVGIYKVLGGVGAGALGGWLLGRNNKSAEVIVLDPDTDLDLTVDSALFID